MTSEEEFDHNVAIRNLLTNIQTGGASSGGTNDCVAQLLAAAVAQFGSNPAAFSSHDIVIQAPQTIMGVAEEANNTGEGDLQFNPEVSGVFGENELKGDVVETTVEIPTTVKRKPVCVKFPVELRKRIIAMRKEGKKCVEVAKELNVSISGAQKVWERFLATGTVHDRKPSISAGRPRKYTQPVEHTQPLETCFAGDGISGYTTTETNENQEGVAVSSGGDESEAPVIVTYNTDILVEGALDVPGATVEVVETDHQPPSTSASSKQSKKGAPAYRQRLLLKLVQDCPLSIFREDPSLAADNPHVVNLSASINKPLYMEYVLGHPFGKVPCPRAFDGSPDEAKVILSDPANPVGKEMLATLGYSTKVYFNACCKPSPMFDKAKLLSSLPFSLGPGYLSETMQAVLQLLLDMCSDPVAAMQRIPEGNGLVLSARTAEGEYKCKRFSSPLKLSDYWTQLYTYASLLECCENFLSANKPSAPCLLCHPFESVVKTLEIQDDGEEEVQVLTAPEKSQQVEVHVLQSGQIEFSAPCKEPSSQQCSSKEGSRRKDEDNYTLATLSTDSCCTEPDTTKMHKQAGVEAHQSSPKQTTAFSQSTSEEVFTQTLAPQPSTSEEVLALPQPSSQSTSGEVFTQTLAPQPSSQSTSGEAFTQTFPSSPIKEKPLIIRRRHGCRRPAGDLTHNLHQQQQLSAPASVSASEAASDKAQKQIRRSNRLSVKTHREEETAPSRKDGYNLRRKQKLSSSNGSPPSCKKSRHSCLSACEVSQTQSTVEASAREKQWGRDNPIEWSVDDVVQFIGSVPRCDYTQVFREHEVDGESLLTLDPEMMVKLMNIKAGPALRIHNKIVELKKYNLVSP